MRYYASCSARGLLDLMCPERPAGAFRAAATLLQPTAGYNPHGSPTGTFDYISVPLIDEYPLRCIDAVAQHHAWIDDVARRYILQVHLCNSQVAPAEFTSEGVALLPVLEELPKVLRVI
jgi:hypothetical protein